MLVESKRRKKEAFLDRPKDIFFFQPTHETFGLVNLEAMEYKLPVISHQ